MPETATPAARPPVPPWQGDFDRTVWAWRAGDRQAGAEACERVLASPGVPEDVASRVRSNATWYAPMLAEWVPRCAFTPLLPAGRAGWSRFNPGLTVLGDGSLLAAVRSSNYRLDVDGSYLVDDPEQVVRSEHLLTALTDELVTGPSRALVAPADRAVTDFPIRGYEDIRLFVAGTHLFALCTVRDLEPWGLAQMVLLALDRTGAIRRETVIDGPEPGRHEKNWSPFDLAGTALPGRDDPGSVGVVYTWDPLVVGELRLRDGRYVERSRRTGSGLGPVARGGSPGVAVADGLLFVVHEVAWMPEGTRRYPHRFVLLDRGGQRFRRTRPFFFLDRGIEFAAGLVEVDGTLLVSFGVADESAWIARIPTADVIARLGGLE
jgi:hypothetical protein